MRAFAILLGVWLGCASLFAQSADKTAAGLRKLGQVCFPKVRTARFVEYTWLSDVPAVAQVWPNSLGFPYRAWLVNETPAGGTLLFAYSVPINVAFDEKPGSPFPRVRCRDIDFAKHLNDLESEIRGADSAKLGNALLLAVLTNISGAREQAVKLAHLILAQSSDMTVPIASALSYAAYGQYAGYLVSYQRTGDLAAFRRDCEVLVKRFPDGWPARSIVLTILSDLPSGGKPAAPPNLSQEDQKLLEEIASYVPTETAVLGQNSLTTRPWLFELPPSMNPAPLEKLLQRGPAAVSFLAAVCDSELPTHYVGGQNGIHGLATIISIEPSRVEAMSDPRDYIFSMMPRPLTVGLLSRKFLISALQLPTPNPDAATVRAEAERWISLYGKLEGAELLRALLKDKSPQEQFRVLRSLMHSDNEKWLPAFEEFVDAQPATQLTLQFAVIFAQRRDKRFHSIPRKFLAKLKSKDDLLPDYFKENSVSEEQISSYREQIDQQLDTIRKAVGEPEPTPPSA